jgi:superfamily II DNA helicase RecQ
MKVRHFIIRLDSDKITSDEKSLNDFLESVDFVKSDVHFIESKVNYWSVLVHFREKETGAKLESNAEEANKISEQNLSPQQKVIFSALKEWRSELAQEKKLPSYTICHNSELLNIVSQEPKSMSDFKKIKGFGDIKIEKYGNDILNILNAK